MYIVYYMVHDTYSYNTYIYTYILNERVVAVLLLLAFPEVEYIHINVS